MDFYGHFFGDVIYFIPCIHHGGIFWGPAFDHFPQAMQQKPERVLLAATASTRPGKLT